MSTVVFGLNLLDELVVDVVASVAGVHLVAGTRDGSVDSTKVSGTCTDVNHEGVVNHVKSIGNSEGFGDDHGRVHGTCSSVKDSGLVDVACFSRSTDDGDNTVVVFGVGKADEVGDEVSDVFSVFWSVLDHTEFKRSVQV